MTTPATCLPFSSRYAATAVGLCGLLLAIACTSGSGPSGGSEAEAGKGGGAAGSGPKGGAGADGSSGGQQGAGAGAGGAEAGMLDAAVDPHLRIDQFGYFLREEKVAVIGVA